MTIRVAIVLLLVGLPWCSVSDAQAEATSKHVLLIGIDGTRPDAIKAAETPNLDKLIANGAYADSTQILGARYRENDTVSGPGWSSLLTGVWADKHGVQDNGFKGKNLQEYPHFFALLKQQLPEAQTASFVDWEPIDANIVAQADVRKLYLAAEAADYVTMDARIVEDASHYLTKGDPRATFVYLGSVDETGHEHGFHPGVEQYKQAIEKVDGQVGKLIAAVQSRPKYLSEDWLVLVSTDHGGRGTGHGNGHEVPEILTTFLIVSGPSAKPGKIAEQTYMVDFPVTALVHLGVKLDPGWKLDGRAVGLK